MDDSLPTGGKKGWNEEGEDSLWREGSSLRDLENNKFNIELTEMFALYYF